MKSEQYSVKKWVKMEKTYATLTNVVEEEYSAQVEITLHQASLYTLSIVEKLMQKF